MSSDWIVKAREELMLDPPTTVLNKIMTQDMYQHVSEGSMFWERKYQKDYPKPGEQLIYKPSEDYLYWTDYSIDKLNHQSIDEIWKKYYVVRSDAHIVKLNFTGMTDKKLYISPHETIEVLLNDISLVLPDITVKSLKLVYGNYDSMSDTLTDEYHNNPVWNNKYKSSGEYVKSNLPPDNVVVYPIKVQTNISSPLRLSRSSSTSRMSSISSSNRGDMDLSLYKLGDVSKLNESFTDYDKPFDIFGLESSLTIG